MRILIVEDDAALGTFLAKGLTLEGHDVRLVADGQSGLQEVIEYAPDLLILDLGLPQKDGIEVLEAMRGRCDATSVLVLTGRNGVQARVQCLNLGADDCLLKPFSFLELAARCKAIMRRKKQSPDSVLRVGSIVLHRMDRTVRRDGHLVDLTTKEFLLLEYLMLAGGKTCLRSELLREVWHSSPQAETNVVDVYVNYLRKKLGAAGQVSGFSGESAKLIKTVRGEGYVLVSDSKKPRLGKRSSDDVVLTPPLLEMTLQQSGRWGVSIAGSGVPAYA